MSIHVNRGLFKSMSSGIVRFGAAGNSIFDPINAYNVYQAYMKQIPLPCVGLSAGPLPAGSNYLAGFAQKNPLGGTEAIIRPGENPGDGDIGFNTTITYTSSGDKTSSFAPALTLSLTRSQLYDSNFDVNQTVRAIVSYRSGGGTNHTNWNVKGYTAAGADSGVGGNIPNIDAASSFRTYTSSSWARGAGSSGNLCYVQSWNEAETGYWKPLGLGIEVPSLTVGMFYAPFVGRGSWGTIHHQNATGASITADAPTYTAAFTDAALNNYYATWRVNYMLMPFGANEPETSGFKARLTTTIQRHRNAAALAGIDLKICLVSQYDLSDDQTGTDAIRSIMREVALSYSFCEFIDFCKWQRDTYGVWSLWNHLAGASAQLIDAVHPATANSTLRTNQANLFYNTLTGTPNVLGARCRQISVGVGVGVGF